jgi:hypothetical protein
MQHPTKWTNEILRDWLESWLTQQKMCECRREKVKTLLGPRVSGKELMRWTLQRFGDLFVEEIDREVLGRGIYQVYSINHFNLILLGSSGSYQ